MKIKNTYLKGLLAMFLFVGCTTDFEEINIDPENAVTAPVAGIMAGVQYFEFAEPRFLTWRGNVIYSSQFSHQFSYNYAGSFFGADSYQNNQGWSDAMFDFSYQKVSLNIRNLLRTYTAADDANGQAVAQIMMSWFYQKMTDLYGDIPYSDVIGRELILANPKPKYDAQEDIYRAIMIDLKVQMDAIGASTTVVSGGAGDYVYQGDPQKWKALANTLRLRMAIRSRAAFIAGGDQAFVDGVITSALSETLITPENQALLKRSTSPLILSFLDGGQEDVYWGFGGNGSKFAFAKRYIDLLQDNNDPRLQKIASPSVTNADFKGSAIGARDQGDRDLLSSPSPIVVGLSTTDNAAQVPIKVFSAAESYFLQAEAAVLGFGGDANALYQQGIRASMAFWTVEDAAADTFVSTQTIATLAGSNTARLNQIWNQRWLNELMNGYESWALVRRTNLIPDLTDNAVFFISQPNVGVVPRRLPYSSTEALNNTENYNAAVSNQGVDDMTTPLWWDVAQ